MAHNSLCVEFKNVSNSSVDSFNKLVTLTGLAFYDDITGDNKTRCGRSDNRGLCVVVLDALTRRQWVREEDLAKDLNLNAKQLRRILRFFEEERLLMRVHRKETAKTTQREEEGRKKMHTYSYCCLDYAQICDVVKYRLHRMKMKLKDELGEKKAIQEYTCPNCKRTYTALDALYLVSSEDEFFHCEHCKGVLVESDKLEAEEMGDGDDNARTRRREKIKYMLQKFEEMLRPLMDQLNRVKDLPVPEFKTLPDWEVENGDANVNDPSKSYNGTPMPSLGETKVDVGANAKSEHTSTPTKVLPPWMIKKGMVLTDEQRGEVKQESNMKGASAAAGLSDDKKSVDQKDEKNSQVAYLEAYYAALYQKQQEQEESNKRKQEAFNTIDDSTSRQVGMKSRRGYNDDDDDGDEDEDVEWEEAPIAGGTLDLSAKSENTSTPTKVLPPRMIKRGEVKQQLNMEGASAAAGLSDEKKSKDQKDEKSLQVAYLEAYYTALYQRQQELEESNKRKQEPLNTIDDSTLRQVGMESKRGYNDDDGGDEDVEWEEVPTAGGTLDLIVEADALGDEEDDIDWEEGYIQSENVGNHQICSVF